MRSVTFPPTQMFSVLLGTIAMSSLLANEPIAPSAAPKSHIMASNFWMKPRPYGEQTGLYLTTSFLYWKAYVPGLWYAVNEPSMNQPGDPVSAGASNIYRTLRGSLAEVHYTAHPGWRAQLGYDPRHQHYGFYLQYTYFHDHGSSHTQGNPDLPGTLEPLQSAQAPTPNVGFLFASSNLHLRYHVWDLIASYAWIRRNPVQLAFLVGATGAWIEQAWTAQFTALATNPPSMTEGFRNNWHYRGGGLKAGLNLDAQLGYGFGLHAQGAFAATVGRMDISYAIGWLNGALDYVSPQDGHSGLNETRFVPAYQFQLGMSWLHQWDRISLGLYADYEVNGWIDIHQLFYSRTTQLYLSEKGFPFFKGSLGLQGLTTGVRLAF